MTNIPEDSTLRRHYLTELKNKQQSTFDGFTSVATDVKPANVVTAAPTTLSNKSVVIGVALFLLVLFIL